MSQYVATWVFVWKLSYDVNMETYRSTNIPYLGNEQLWSNIKSWVININPHPVLWGPHGPRKD